MKYPYHQWRSRVYCKTMCGLNGFNWRDEQALEQMNSATKSRGPDLSGRFCSDDMSLGHLLLAIRDDAATSRQPFIDNPEWVLIYNGQIYNTQTLIKKLSNLDPHKTDLDTYLIYKAIEQFGWNFITHIEGMFAIALYNTKLKELRLYRDPAGQKQLYYYSKGNQFIFSSEIKGIFEHEIDKSIDEVGLATSTRIGYIPGHHTLFTHIKKLNPGEELIFKNNVISRSFYGKPQEPYYFHNLSQAFSQLVSEHLQSKQKIALNLSGGLDSSILLHEMSQGDQGIHTYSTFFEGLSSESSYNRDAQLANQLSRDYATDHHQIAITKDSFLANFIEAYEIIEEPNFNVSLPVYLETAKAEGIQGDKNRVVLSGDGGDEIFGGYNHYKEAQRLHNLMKTLTPPLFNILKNWRNHTHLDYSDPSSFWLWKRGLSQDGARNGRIEAEQYIKHTGDILSSLNHASKKDFVYDIMLRDRFLWMPGENFIRSDKLYMSQSLEMRSPFAFEPFRNYIDSILTTQDYVDTSSNKIRIRKLYKGKLPDYIIERQDKTGWRSPLEEWYDRDMKKLFLDILAPMKDGRITWSAIRDHVTKNDRWPGKHVHLYLSLAILAQKYKIDL